MKSKLILILFFIVSFSYSQKNKKDTLYIIYKNESNLVRKTTSEITKISGFEILYDRFKTKEDREKRLKYLREHGGGATGFYIGFTGDKNFIVTGNLNEYELYTAEDISKLKLIMQYGQKVFFIEKLGCNKYKFHETHNTYD